MKKRIEIRISDASCTDDYINILKEHNMNLGTSIDRSKSSKRTAFSKEMRKLDDEEARSSNRQLHDMLSYLIGKVENRRKTRSRKLNVPKSIMTFVQTNKDELKKRNGTHGEVQAFLINALDARLHEFHKVHLVPPTDFRKTIPSKVRMTVLKHLMEPVLIERVLPSQINVTEIAEKVLKEKQNLAEKKLIIQTINDLLDIE
jgi:hypothetical protein